jgi:uncharacterized membrane protein YqjE
MWKTALKLLAVVFFRNRINNVTSDFNNNFGAVKENIAVMAESRAAIFKQNFNDDLQRLVNSLFGFMVILLTAVCSGLTGILWLVASAWSSPNRNIILGTTMILPLLIGISVFVFIRYSWQKEPLFSRSIKQIETDWSIIRGDLDGTADISDEDNK